MSEQSQQAEHPTDALPEYVRGVVADADAIERHVAVCDRCRDEVELLRRVAETAPVAMTAEERRRTRDAIERRRAAVGSGGASGHGALHGEGFPALGSPASGHGWRSAAWKVAAAIALLLTGLGVWRIVEVGGSAADRTGWNPQAAIEGWERDLADLQPDARAVRLALGVGGDEGTGLGGPWESGVGEPVDPEDSSVPWEERR